MDIEHVDFELNSNLLFIVSNERNKNILYNKIHKCLSDNYLNILPIQILLFNFVHVYSEDFYLLLQKQLLDLKIHRYAIRVDYPHWLATRANSFWKIIYHQRINIGLRLGSEEVNFMVAAVGDASFTAKDCRKGKNLPHEKLVLFSVQASVVGKRKSLP